MRWVNKYILMCDFTTDGNTQVKQQQKQEKLCRQMYVWSSLSELLTIKKKLYKIICELKMLFLFWYRDGA